MRAILFSTRICPEDASRRVVDQRYGIILPATAPDKRGRAIQFSIFSWFHEVFTPSPQ